MTTAVVVGSGPNGMSAALRLARAGVTVTVVEAYDEPGGGLRSSTDATVPGLVHDLGAGFHPMLIDNPFTQEVDLEAAGVEWAWPEVQFAHPLDTTTDPEGGAAAYRSIDETAAGLGRDGATWRRIFTPLAEGWHELAEDALRPPIHVPRHPIGLVRFGLQALMPASVMARQFRTERARALWTGIATHGFRPPSVPMSSAIALMLGASGHRFGWPVAVGGSARIVDATTSLLEGLGGKVETGRRITSLDELGSPDLVMLDTGPADALRILGDRAPALTRRAYDRWPTGSGAFQVSFAVDGGIPWSYEPARSAGTLHLGGDLADMTRAERTAEQGRLPDLPYVLLGQQYLADPSRCVGSTVPIDCYAHVPTWWSDGDAALAAVTARIERYAPGFSDRVVATSVRGPEQLFAENPNWVGGDIAAGLVTPLRLAYGARPTLSPYDTGVDGVHLCSAVTPPGPGAHGLCGWNAAGAALKELAKR
ncbi:NAD(P)/FAD-dependent oxidoreductase [Nocardioides sp. CFH 31398]|uniref:phytoene desaturase family protein n=1 Tax=Nocardioides sp. CFH 31398 TaxID=2919579 RepID=UPI001F05DD84|nr:NAD(P)/FAD-dependent oxidoreductase [Nocardioides sp. CFH 31398]MCH1866371.1 NAD(P)/FAD-dependent oxidoreductase [Nocardioides sp. CFH 31398]